MIDVKISKDEITPALESFMQYLNPSKLKRFAGSQNRLLLENLNDSFNRQVWFDKGKATKWEPLAASTVRKRQRQGTWYGKGKSTLKESLAMWSELGSNSETKIIGDGVSTKIWSDNSIAKEHQYGVSAALRAFGGALPARPVYSLSNKTMRAFEKNFSSYLDKALRGAASGKSFRVGFEGTQSILYTFE